MSGSRGSPSTSYKYQKHARYQEGRVRYLEQELKPSREELIESWIYKK
jgi:hypothetical protein